jgi:tol-pal system protein YbgF
MIRYKKGAGVQPAPFFVACCFVISVHALAEVPVVEIEDKEAVTSVRAAPDTNIANPAATAAASMPAGSRQNQLSEIFVQMQQLQHEVQELRGTVEQQSFEIEALKQQVKDNYIDLDRRISTLQSGSVTASTGSGSATTLNSTSGAGVELPASGAEKDSYDNAYKLLDQNHKDDAIIAFRKHIALYPNGDLAANAYYWMGQIYLTQGQLDLAQEQFVMLLKTYPNHRKVPDAKFALGKVYFQQGNKTEAKKMIQEVSQGDSNAAALAKTFLQDNF